MSAYTVPTEQPEADGTLAWDSTTVVVVQPQLSDGSVGLGFSYGTPAMATLISQVLAPVVQGREIDDVDLLWELMVVAVRNLGRPGICSMAIAAVDIALWDSRARWLGRPLHQLLGSTRGSVPVYGSGGFTTYSDRTLLDQMAAFVDSGVPRVKMKIGVDRGANPKEDLRRVQLVRRAIGDSCELFVDANGAYDLKTALGVGRQLHERAGVSWFEEPVSSDDLSGLSLLRERLPLEVTAGEYGYDLTYFARMLDAGAVDVIQADVSRCGGISEWLRVAALARARHVPISAHCAPTLHLAPGAVAANLRHVEYFHDHTRIDKILFTGAPEQVGGALPLPNTPGMGLQLNPAAQRYRVG